MLKPRARVNTHIEEEDRGELGRLVRDGLVERGTGLGPRRPEVEERDTVQVLRKKLLEVLWRGDFDEVGGHFDAGELNEQGSDKWSRMGPKEED